jgi:hypothetical protein
MKKIIIIIIIIICAVILLQLSANFRHDYRKDAGTSSIDTGRVATIKLKSGHIRMYYQDVDSGYFTEAPECPICNEQRRNQQIEDSLKAIIKIRKEIMDTLVYSEQIEELQKEEPADSIS